MIGEEDEPPPVDFTRGEEALERVKETARRINERVKKASETDPDLPILNGSDETKKEKPLAPSDPGPPSN